MTIYRFSNNAATTLGSAISPTATTITVASGTGARFPSPAAGQYFTATLFAAGSSTGIPNEIVLVTARSGDSMTVIRGQEGSTAQAWSVGDTFDNFVTAAFLNQLVDAGSLQAQSGNFAFDTGTANVGVITLVPAPASLDALVGVPIRFKKVASTNTGGYTLNVNSFGAKIVRLGGRTIEAGQLAGSSFFEVVWDGTSFELWSNPVVWYGDGIAPNTVTNALLVSMGASTLKGNLTGSATTPYDVPLSDLSTALGLSGGLSADHVVFSNGLIVQWFKGAFDPPGSGEHAQTIAFPIAFPNHCWSVQVTTQISVPNNYTDYWYQLAGVPTTTNCTVYRQRGNDGTEGNGTTPWCIAIGN